VRDATTPQSRRGQARTARPRVAVGYHRRVVPRLLRLLPALGAFFVLAIVLAACADSLPGNAVVKVGDETITHAEFVHWMGIAQATSQGSQPSAPKTVYDPPAFTACIAKLRAGAPKPKPGQPKPSDVALKALCKKSYEDTRKTVLSFLINDKWIRGEASDQGVKVSDKQLAANFDKVRKQQFPAEADFQKFLKGAAMTVQDAKLQVASNTLSTKLRDKVVKDAAKVTNRGILDYYNKHKSRFATPQKRDIRVVLTKAKAKANQAKTALEHGQSWKVVAKRFSVDTATKTKGGAILDLPKGRQEPALDTAIFGTTKGKLVGPVPTQFGFYVFQVQKIVPAKQQSLKQATPMIKQLLRSSLERSALTKFANALDKKWRAKTTCREGYNVTKECKNAAKEKTTATPAGAQSGGAQPGGAQPGGQPQPQQAPPAQP
jgi:foldase protein PrsA